MKIAFDVKGTLAGPEKILKLFKILHDKGHDLIVWSNSYSYAFDMVSSLQKSGLVTVAASKYGTWDSDRGLFDFAVEDDTSQTWLAANKIIFVHDIPEDNLEKFAEETFK